MSRIAIVGWIYESDGRHPDEVKVAKLVDWPVPKDLYELHSLLGLAVYLRILVKRFAILTMPLPYYAALSDLKSGSYFV